MFISAIILYNTDQVQSYISLFRKSSRSWGTKRRRKRKRCPVSMWTPQASSKTEKKTVPAKCGVPGGSASPYNARGWRGVVLRCFAAKVGMLHVPGHRGDRAGDTRTTSNMAPGRPGGQGGQGKARRNASGLCFYRERGLMGVAAACLIAGAVPTRRAHNFFF